MILKETPPKIWGIWEIRVNLKFGTVHKFMVARGGFVMFLVLFLGLFLKQTLCPIQHYIHCAVQFELYHQHSLQKIKCKSPNEKEYFAECFITGMCIHI